MLACPTGFPHVLGAVLLGIWNSHGKQQLATSYRSLLANYGTEYLPKEAFDWAWASEGKKWASQMLFCLQFGSEVGRTILGKPAAWRRQP